MMIDFELMLYTGISLHREPPEVGLVLEVCIGGWSRVCHPNIDTSLSDYYYIDEEKFPGLQKWTSTTLKVDPEM